jgi:cell division transport system ATP-binding protein
MPRWSVFENVALALRVAGVKGIDLADRVEKALAQVGLEQVAGARADSLSGGEQQRAAIARALVHEPALVLADEPSGNLDPGNAREVLKLLVAAHARGATVILATHDPKLLNMVRGARVVRLEAGRLEEA